MRIMLEFNVLILTSLTLFVVSLLILFYLVVTKSKEVERLKQVLQGTIKKVGLHNHDCSHYLGYLFSYPRHRPIPNECMGCTEVFECLEHKKSKPTPLKETSRGKEAMKHKTVKVRKPKTTKKAATSKTEKKIASSMKAKTKPGRTSQKKKVTRTRNKRR